MGRHWRSMKGEPMDHNAALILFGAFDTLLLLLIIFGVHK